MAQGSGVTRPVEGVWLKKTKKFRQIENTKVEEDRSRKWE